MSLWHFTMQRRCNDGEMFALISPVIYHHHHNMFSSVNRKHLHLLCYGLCLLINRATLSVRSEMMKLTFSLLLSLILLVAGSLGLLCLCISLYWSSPEVTCHENEITLITTCYPSLLQTVPASPTLRSAKCWGRRGAWWPPPSPPWWGWLSTTVSEVVTAVSMSMIPTTPGWRTSWPTWRRSTRLLYR